MNAKPQHRFRERRARMRALLKCRGAARIDFNEGLKLYRYRWDQSSATGDGWTTNWIASGSRAICQHKREGCRCGWQNYCGDYRSGEFALWWQRGCQREPIRIRCTVEER